MSRIHVEQHDWRIWPARVIGAVFGAAETDPNEHLSTGRSSVTELSCWPLIKSFATALVHLVPIVMAVQSGIGCRRVPAIHFSRAQERWFSHLPPWWSSRLQPGASLATEPGIERWSMVGAWSVDPRHAVVSHGAGWRHIARSEHLSAPRRGGLAGSPKASLEELETAPARKL